MKSVISKVPLLAIPLVIAEYVHTGTGALERVFDFDAHPVVSVLMSASFAIVLAISAFCALIYVSRFCLWTLTLLEQSNAVLQGFVRRGTLNVLKRAVSKLEETGPSQARDVV